jgi:hypothetical protein
MPVIKKTSDSSWLIELEEDNETDELLLPLPQEVLDGQGWAIGDTLTWKVNEDRTITLAKSSPKLESGS